ncbi:hypothetical protein MUP77_04790, partial [Candidatus Bathyarchaeota archaeon]|nr:hypothetical protein [Candidatus Bathyarchaeota archaeon]
MVVRQVKLASLVKDNLKLVTTKHCVLGKNASAIWTEQRKDVIISMDENAMQLFDETVSNIIKFHPDFKEKFTETYLRNRLIDIVFACHAIPSSILDAQLVKEVRNVLRLLQRTAESWIFLVPVVNLRLVGVRKVSIGEVDFYG